MRRSLAVTDQVILQKLPLRMVLDQLVAQNGGGFTSTQLFRQLWDTQNPAPGQPDLPLMPHCSDNINTLNGFPYPCRQAEGSQAEPDSPVNIDSYAAIGLFNRFDVAPLNGADCGEYRIVYAKLPLVANSRNLIIFEAVLPNPRPDLGLDGCRPVTNFWRDLSIETDANARAAALQGFYFNGLPTADTPVSPVIHVDNYGKLGPGQIRVNMFMQFPWLLREFKLKRTCNTFGCTLFFDPVTDKTNPFGDLFDPSSTDPRASAFQDHFVTQVANLAIKDLNRFNYDVPDDFNVGQSDSQSPFGVVDDYVAQFGPGPSLFRFRIQQELTAIGSTLTPDDIVARAQALSCGGCHQRSNNADLGDGLTWPASANFVHNAETTELGPDGTRFQLSPALDTVFLPHRRQVFGEFLGRLRPVATAQMAMTGVAAFNGDAYWAQNTNPGSVMKTPVGGSPKTLLGGRSALAGLATDGKHVYWLENTNPGSILKMPVGGNAPTTLVSGRFNLSGIATDGADVYWTENGSPGNIMKVSTGGGTPVVVLTNRLGARAISVDATHLYWAEAGGNIMKMPKIGTAPVTLASGRPAVTGTASDGQQLYWTENTNPGKIVRMGLPLGTATDFMTGLSNLRGVAVDGWNVYWIEDTNPGTVVTIGK